MDDWNIDSHKLQYHPDRVAQWREATTWEQAKHVYPLYWEITTSAACNHRCTFCSVDAIGYPTIMAEEGILAARMAEAARLGVRSVMFAGTGEPLIHKRIGGIVEDAKKAGLDCAITTNGVVLEKFAQVPECSWIKVSLNAGAKQTYAKVHQTDERDWDRVWKGIRSAVSRKGKCTIGVQTVVLPENVAEVPVLARMCREAGVDYLVLKPYSQGTFSITRRYEGTDYKAMQARLEAAQWFSTPTFKVIYRSESMSQEAKPHQYSKCNATPFFWTYTMADGRMFSCSAHLLDDRFCIGNINEQSFQEIWEGEGRKRNWEMMQSFNIKLCRLNCRMDKANRYLADFDRIQHINFI